MKIKLGQCKSNNRILSKWESSQKANIEQEIILLNWGHNSSGVVELYIWPKFDHYNLT